MSLGWTRQSPHLYPALFPVASPIQGVPRCARGLYPCWGVGSAPLPSIPVLRPDAPGGLQGDSHGGTGWSWLALSSAISPHVSPQSARGAVQLRGRASELEAELAEQQHLKQQAQDESEFLRTELEELKKQREDTEKAQRSLTEIESEQGVPAPAQGGGESQAGGPRCSALSLRVWQDGHRPTSSGTAN